MRGVHFKNSDRQGGGTIFIWNYISGIQFSYTTLFWTPPPPRDVINDRSLKRKRCDKNISKRKTSPAGVGQAKEKKMEVLWSYGRNIVWQTTSETTSCHSLICNYHCWTSWHSWWWKLWKWYVFLLYLNGYLCFFPFVGWVHCFTVLGHVHTYPKISFLQTFFADAKILASTRSVFESFSAVHTYPIVSRNFLICSSAQFFCRRESWNEHAHNCDLGAISFAP